MRLIIYLFLISSLFSYSQEGQSFHLKDVIFLKVNEQDKIHDFLKSRYFDYIGIDSAGNSYSFALNYDRTSKKASTWCFKYFDGRLKILETGDGNLLMNIKGQLKTYKVDFIYQPDGWILTEFHYEKFAIGIRENDVLDRYELYIQDKL